MCQHARNHQASSAAAAKPRHCQWQHCAAHSKKPETLSLPVSTYSEADTQRIHTETQNQIRATGARRKQQKHTRKHVRGWNALKMPVCAEYRKEPNLALRILPLPVVPVGGRKFKFGTHPCTCQCRQCMSSYLPCVQASSGCCCCSSTGSGSVRSSFSSRTGRSVSIRSVCPC